MEENEFNKFQSSEEDTAEKKITIARLLKKNISLVIGIIIILIIVFSAVFAPYITPYSPTRVDMPNRFRTMSSDHFFGTDAWGRDVFTRVVYGGRYSLTIGLISIGMSMAAGLFLGIIAGFYPKAILSKIITWFTDIVMSFPTLILGALIAIMFGTGVFNTILAISIAFVPRFIRLVRASVLSVREEEYIDSARSIGMSDLRIIFMHVIPNIISPIIVMGVLWVSSAITIEVALSFIGLGVSPPTPSWGTILQDNLRYFLMDPAAVLWPSVTIALTIVGLNLISDRFRDMLDPKMR